jgi:hypothetical protein
MLDIKHTSDDTRSEGVKKSKSPDILRRMCAQAKPASRDTASAPSSPRGTDSVPSSPRDIDSAPSSPQDRGKRPLSAQEMAQEEMQRQSSPIGEDGKPAEKALDLHSTAMLGGMPRRPWEWFCGKHDGEASTSSGSSNLERANLEHNCAEIRNSLKNSQYSMATELCERLLAIKVWEWGQDHPKTLATVDALHKIVKDSYCEEMWEQWKDWAQSVFDICVQKLGPDHPKTLATVDVLRNIKRKTEKYCKDDFPDFVADVCKTYLGSYHDKTLDAKKKLYQYSILRENFFEAKEHAKSIAEICGQKFGLNHSKTLDAADKAVTAHLKLSGSSDWDYQKEVLNFCGHYIFNAGWDNSNTPKALDRLLKKLDLNKLLNRGKLYLDNEEYEKAADTYKCVVAICRKKFGADHDKTKEALNNLWHATMGYLQESYRVSPLISALLTHEGMWVTGKRHTAREAADYSLPVIAALDQTVGTDNPRTRDIRDGIARNYLKWISNLENDREEQAKAWWHITNIYERYLKENDPRTGDALNNLYNATKLYLEQSYAGKNAAERHREAADWSLPALAKLEQKFGEDDYRTRDIRDGIARNYLEQISALSDDRAIANAYKHAIPIFDQKFPNDFETIAEHYLAWACSIPWAKSEKECREAVELRESNFAILEQRFGPNDPRTVKAANNLVRAYVGWARSRLLEEKSELGCRRAVELHKSIYAKLDRIFEPNDPRTAEFMSSLVEIYLEWVRKLELPPLSKGKYIKVVASPCKQFIAKLEERVGPNDPRTVKAVEGLAQIYSEWVKPNRKELYQQAVELGEYLDPICKRILGEDHIMTLKVVIGLAQSYYCQRKYMESAKLWKHALPTCHKILGTDHPMTQRCQETLDELSHQETREKASEGIFDSPNLIEL